MLSGVFPAALTMFDRAGNLDREATADHLRWLVRSGAHGVVVGGTSGEFIGLTDQERVQLFEVAVQAVGGAVPVIVGTGSFSTRKTIELTNVAAAAGADGAIVILPYYQRPQIAEVIEHYRQVGRAADLPIMVYNNPANSAAPELSPDHLAELYAEGVIHAVKATHPTVHQVQETVLITGGKLAVFYGSFMAPLEALAGGAHGWISGILNVATPEAVQMWEALKEGDLITARGVAARVTAVRRIFTRQQLGNVGDLSIYRGMLRVWGRPAGYCRTPLLDLDSDQMATLEGILGGIYGSASAKLA